jgi:aspartyl-tRNA(Asn)/glutamyl-tRNA(Gln) amidotransferase subunit A
LKARLARISGRRSAVSEETGDAAGEFRRAFGHRAREIVNDIERLRAIQALGPCLLFDPNSPAAAPGRGIDIWEIGPDPDLGRLRGRDPVDMTVRELTTALRGRALSASGALKAFHRRIDDLDPILNAFITVISPGVGPSADGSGPRFGVPFAANDLIETAGIETTAGSKQLRRNIPTDDADVIGAFRKAGAILVGKLNTHEFASGATGDNPHFGVVRNPWDLDRLAGGSSSGSAAAVAARLVPFALGTDTAGSIRIPASLCGVVGLKPTFGLISCRGVIPEAWSLDHVGFLTRSAVDLPLLLAAATGSRSMTRPHSPPADLAGVRIGVPVAWMDAKVAPAVAAAITGSLARLADLGASVREIPFPDPDDLTAITRFIMLSEAAAWHRPFLQASPDLYGDDVRARFEFGSEITAAEYINANRLRARLCRQLQGTWSEVDVLVTPSTPITAPPIGAEPAITASLGRFTAAANLLGWPALSMPCGFDEGGLPIGLQLMAPPFDEDRLLRIAAALEEAMDVAQAQPQLIARSAAAPLRC